MQVLLSAQEVSKTYASNPKKALDNVSMEVRAGEFIGIMGASGSGKTTLLNVLSTIDTSSSGEIMINGVHLNQLDDTRAADFRRDNLGFIFQDYFLLDSLTVHQNIAVPLALQGVPSETVDQTVQALAERFLISSQLSKYPGELSGGQRQRVAAARAIVKRPAILFADEPTGALDSSSATELLHTLSEANRELGTTILMVTHDAYAASFAERILIFKDGRILSELRQAGRTRQNFYTAIMDQISVLDDNR
ncbi:ABC transporter ATP-binding protein [Paenibacillus sp. 22594]|uniref:ABC transporter ATP-binding protein n=1 Tax=Paenibacillus sp. 22594 TaxID=3453947 RepID=UPI003F83B637